MLIEYDHFDWLSEYATFEYNYFWNYSSFIRCESCDHCRVHLHPYVNIHAFGHRINFAGKKVTALRSLEVPVRLHVCIQMNALVVSSFL